MSYGKQQELAWLKWELESMKVPQIKTFYAIYFRQPCVFAQCVRFSQLWGTKKKSVAVSLRSEPARVSQDKISLKPLWKVVSESVVSFAQKQSEVLKKVRVLDGALLCWMLLCGYEGASVWLLGYFKWLLGYFGLFYSLFTLSAFFIPANENNVYKPFQKYVQ